MRKKVILDTKQSLNSAEKCLNKSMATFFLQVNLKNTCKNQLQQFTMKNIIETKKLLKIIYLFTFVQFLEQNCTKMTSCFSFESNYIFGSCLKRITKFEQYTLNYKSFISIKDYQNNVRVCTYSKVVVVHL